MIRATLISLGLLTSPLAAQQSYDFDRHFALFNEFCGAAMKGLEPLKAVTQVPGPSGERVFAVSPDGNLITYQTGRDDFLIIGSFRYQPGFVIRECMVQQIGASVQKLDEIEAEFLARAPSGDGISATGGRVVEDIPPVGAFAVSGGMITRPRASYVIYGAMEPQGTIMQSHLADGMFTLNAFVLAAR